MSCLINYNILRYDLNPSGMFRCLRRKSSDTVPTIQTPVCSFRDLVLVSEPPAGGAPVGLRSASVVHVTLERTDMLDETTSDGSKTVGNNINRT